VQANRRGIVTPIVVALISLAGLVASVDLLDVFFEVRQGEATGDSFCTLSDALDCEKVAASEYSVFLGVPYALWGIGLYGLLLLGAVVRLIRRDEGAFRWDAVFFWLPFVVLLDDVYLVYLQFTCIGSVCIVCVVTYGLNLLLVLALLLERRFGLVGLAREARADLVWLFSGVRAYVSAGAVVAGLVAVGWFWAHPMGGLQLSPSTTDRPSQPGTEPVRGPLGAPVTVLGITDFQCPYCGRAAQAVEHVLEKYGDRIRFEHIDYPLDQACNPYIPKPFHRLACYAAYASRCAARQGKYWHYHHLLFDHQKELDDRVVLDLAGKAGLDLPAFKACLSDPEGSLKRSVAADIERARQYKIQGTPTFVVNGKVMPGYLSAEKWDAVLAPLLGDPAPVPVPK
jgi:protein-disulfide isomerase/uncharacterized membrane protein